MLSVLVTAVSLCLEEFLTLVRVGQLDSWEMKSFTCLHPNNLKTNSSYPNIVLNSNKPKAIWEAGGFEPSGSS